MPLDLARVAGLSGFAERLGREFVVEADKQVDQLAADRRDAEQVR
jgi:hypothetical protein